VAVVVEQKTQVVPEFKTPVAVMVVMDTHHLFLALARTRHMLAVVVVNCKTELAAQAAAQEVQVVVALMGLPVL